jgi:hypothetical protein
MTKEQSAAYSKLLESKTKEQRIEAVKELYKSFGIELLPEELEVVENWENP